MPASGAAPQQSMTWLFFALLTVSMWGVYGIFLHKGAVGMPGDPNARYKAFLFVGIAYFITAVLAPAAVLAINGATWKFSGSLMWWSLIAGIVGAIGAFGVLLAFGARGTPAVVMSIIFAGAPVVNAALAITMDKNWGNVRWQFMLGILLAAIGGCLVTYYKPAPAKPHGAAKPAAPLVQPADAPPVASHTPAE